MNSHRRKHNLWMPSLTRSLLPLLLLASLLVAPANAMADQMAKVTVTGNETVLTPHFVWLKDTGNWPDIHTLTSLQSKPPWEQQKRLPTGYVTQPVWLRVTLKNTQPDSSERYLVFDSPLLDTVDLYLLHNGDIIQQQQHRLRTPVAYRKVNHRMIILPVSLPPDAETTLYLRVTTDTSMLLGASLWKPRAFLLNDQHWLTLHVFLLGMMTVMALYNLAVYMITRIRAYLLYVAYVVSNAAFQACMVGFAHQYLFGSSQLLLGNGQFTLAAITFVTATAFIDELLKLKLTSPMLHRVAMTILVTWSVLFCLSFFVPESQLGPIIFVLAIVSPIAGLWIGIHLWRKGYEIAPLFTIAWVVLLVGTCVFVLMINGVIERNVVTVHIQEVGAALEVVLLAITLAKRLQIERQKRHRAQEHAILMAQQVNNERKEKLDAQATALDAERKTREAQEELVQTQLKANLELERMVEQRTTELKGALEQVEQMNQQLEQLSITDALTGAFNRRYFDAQLAEVYERSRAQRTPMGLALIDIDFFKKINDEHGHLVGDQCLKLVARQLQEQTRTDVDIVARYGGEEFAIISPNTDSTQLWEISERIRSAIEATPYPYRDITVNLTASIGVSQLNLQSPQNRQQLLQEADDALYQSKQQGRNRVTSAMPARQAKP